jgi:ubiquinone biosynthesis protein COQ9
MAAPNETISDMTPEELRTPLLDAMMDHIAFDGWSMTALNNAAGDIGVSPEMAELAFPRGAIEVLEFHLDRADQRLMQTLLDMDLPSMRIRDRITVAVRTRLEQNTKHREAIARGLNMLAMPQHLALGSKTLWRTADTMWRAAGDTSTDHNWYTKRMTLSGVYSAVLLYWLNDESDDFEDTWEFLDRRIENVMKIEKAKFEMRKATANMPSLSRFLGRLRYPTV